jgi:hypothetical protein
MPLQSFGTASGPNCSSILSFARRNPCPTSADAASCLKLPHQGKAETIVGSPQVGDDGE